MARRRVAASEQGLADEQCRDAVAEADLDRPRCTFAHDPLAERLTLGDVNCDGEKAVHRPIRPGDHCAVAEQPLDHLSYLSQRRPSRCPLATVTCSEL